MKATDLEKNIEKEKVECKYAPQKQQPPLDKRRLVCLGIAYFIILFWVIVFKCNQNERLCVEFQPFKSIWGHFLAGAIPFKNIVGILMSPGEAMVFFLNFILFIPMGILFPFFLRKRTSICIIFAVALGVEILQLFTGWGGYDSTDVIITFLGGVFGMWIFKKLRPLVPNALVNTLAYGIYLAFMPLAAFVILNTAVNFPPIGHTTLF